MMRYTTGYLDGRPDQRPKKERNIDAYRSILRLCRTRLNEDVVRVGEVRLHLILQGRMVSTSMLPRTNRNKGT